MPDTGKREPDKVTHIRWEPDEYERLDAAAQVLASREHLDLSVIDVIRAGTRRYVAELLVESELMPVPNDDMERRHSDRRVS